jgi:hypothetical protein
MKLALDHGFLCDRNTVDLFVPIFSKLVTFYLGFKIVSTVCTSVLSTSDSQQLTGGCYYDTTKYEGQHDAMFSVACIV